MKKLLLTLFLTNFIFLAYLQAQNLADFNKTRLQKQQTSMLILGSWAVGNIAVGSILGSQRSGEDKYFHLMNAGWNVVNIGLATAGYFTAIKTDPAAMDLAASLDAQHQIQKIFLFNVGLDVGYMAGGLYLIERSKNTTNKPERLKGFGKSIVLQGGFLFIFDLAAYWVQSLGNKSIAPLLEGLTFDGQSVGFMYYF